MSNKNQQYRITFVDHRNSNNVRFEIFNHQNLDLAVQKLFGKDRIWLEDNYTYNPTPTTFEFGYIMRPSTKKDKTSYSTTEEFKVKVTIETVEIKQNKTSQEIAKILESKEQSIDNFLAANSKPKPKNRQWRFEPKEIEVKTELPIYLL